MNLKDQLVQLKKSDPTAIPLSVAVPEQITTEELKALRETAVVTNAPGLDCYEKAHDVESLVQLFSLPQPAQPVIPVHLQKQQKI
jgi:hypothetical protein